ncbi:MAG: ATP-binding protein [Sphingomonadaceae bacterium]|nr:ATP-binding protein [Sphingomonadaceae bacterium]
MIRVCFHGAESTGKSVLAAKLAEELACPWVPEYGREYAEEHGTEFAMEDLLAIAHGQDAAMQAACAGNPPLVILDTDPLMTAAWAQMLFGKIPAELFAYTKAEHYLLFAADTPWQADGTRMFGTDQSRAQFAAVAEDMLVRARVPFTRIGGSWDERETLVRAILAEMAQA